jgi:hypothetical protein
MIVIRFLFIKYFLVLIGTFLVQLGTLTWTLVFFQDTTTELIVFLLDEEDARRSWSR